MRLRGDAVQLARSQAAAGDHSADVLAGSGQRLTDPATLPLNKKALNSQLNRPSGPCTLRRHDLKPNKTNPQDHERSRLRSHTGLVVDQGLHAQKL